MEKSKLISIFFRSFLLNGSLNFWKMQNLGFCFSLLPLLDAGRIEKIPFLVRHLRYFYTHPYLVSAILGSVIKVEEEVEERAKEEVSKIKDAFMSPYAAIGDQFFWDRWLPFTGLVCAGLALTGAVVAPLLFVFLFIPWQLWIRWKGFIEGYRLGKEGFTYIQNLRLTGYGSTVRRWSVVAAVLLLLLWAQFVHVNREGIFLPVVAFYGMGFAVCLAGFFIARAGISPVVTFYVVAAILCVLLI